MKKINIIILVSFVFALWFFVLWSESQVKVTISWQWLIIWTPDNLNLGTTIPSSVVTKNFSDYFWINDLRGNDTGHYTTIQMDALYGPNDAMITWIQIMANTLDLLNWTINNTLINPDLSVWSDMRKPVLFFYRNNSLNNWRINKYWTKPSIRIIVPTDVPSGNYKWKITYTLYDYDTNITN